MSKTKVETWIEKKRYWEEQKKDCARYFSYIEDRMIFNGLKLILDVDNKFVHLEELFDSDYSEILYKEVLKYINKRVKARMQKAEKEIDKYAQLLDNLAILAEKQ
jgi:hypothetical protein